ncbi:hypothetical protein L211DRAFT_863628 [Terfezia boudieri ATCC MYA-4762]|uniref:HNH nuclease domain-containing protein n=1 Tax=Terfezia boudieri ATCC MYA-4762 TaxID=1051890 RepID=A0A3N4L9B7_9PEZI|nr:hypothetical protein L211DRAFT_863628 [Terfezia boudieri ATCC MYA-4762]
MSHNVSGRDGVFMTGIRARNGKCVVSAVMNPRLGVSRREWAGFEVAYIFPLEKEDPVWILGNLGRWITDMDDTNGSSKINSLQNGMLLGADIHTLFDQYTISVDPDRWHFRQSIFSNMRGAGEPILEHDFSGRDMIGVISKETKWKSRLA